MSDILATIQRGKEDKPRKVLLYGIEGIGKSTWASMADRPIFLPTEDNLSDIDCARLPLATHWDHIAGALQALHEGKHDFKTLVIDTLDGMEPVVWAKTCIENGWKSIEEPDFQKGYTEAMTWWRSITVGLDMLRNDRGMEIILVAHSTTKKFDSPESAPFDQYVPKIHWRPSAHFREWCSEVFFACNNVLANTVKGAFGSTHTFGVGGDERIIRTAARPFCSAKCHLPGVPTTIPLDYRVWAQYVAASKGQGPAPQPEAPTAAPEPTTTEPPTAEAPTQA